MSKRTLAAVVALVLAATVIGSSQEKPPEKQTLQMAATAVRGYHNLQRNLTEAAEKMPDADYSFKPTPEMRPFSQLIAHTALAQFGNCSILKGQPNPHKDDKEEGVKTKADALALLKASTALCDDAFGSVTDQNFLEMMTMPQGEVARGLLLVGIHSHGNEMYGTMSVYLRLKGLVPPSTERMQQAAAKEKEKEAQPKKSGSDN
jgi:uncharacterized damage-inducible protein DinB